MLPKVFAAQARKAREEEGPVKTEPRTVEERSALFTDFVDRAQAEGKRRGLGDMKLLNVGDEPPWSG